MQLPLDFYDKLRASIRVSEIVGKKVVLTRKGLEYTGLCPFHDEKTPSFTVNDAKRFYHCFGCGAHGDLIRFLSETTGISYKNAAIQIAQNNGIEIPKLTASQSAVYQKSERLHQLLKFAQDFFVDQITPDIITYLTNRGINKDTIKEFNIGYSPGGNLLEQFLYSKNFSMPEMVDSGLFRRRESSNKLYSVFNRRIMFPISDSFNKIVAFGGRALGDQMPKYINSPETKIFKKSEIMFGNNIANSYFYKDNYAILVEGYIDVIVLHQAGFKHAVASLGTAVTQSHIMKLWNSCDEIIICLDGDSAGERAVKKIIDIALPKITATKSISFVQLPEGRDPDDLIKYEGSKAFAKCLDKRSTLSEKIWQNEYSGKSFARAEERAALESVLESRYMLIADHKVRNSFKRYFNDMIWQNIIFKKKDALKFNVGISAEVKSCKSYSEIEFLERAICTFFVYFPLVAKNSNITLLFKDSHLDDMKSWILDHLENNGNIDFLKKDLKNSRFSDLFELLSSQKKIFLRDIFESKKNIDHALLFEWLCKKHYLLSLREEYASALRNSDCSEESKLESYLKEIQKTTQDLIRLNEIVAD